EERVTTVGWYDTGTSHDPGIQQEPFFYTGYQGWPVSWLRDNRPETERAAVVAAARGLEACGYDPAVRVRFQAEAGIEAEVIEFIPIYGPRGLRGKEAPAPAGGPCTGLQSCPLAFLEITNVTVDEVQHLAPSFEAALQAQMACGCTHYHVRIPLTRCN